MRHTLVKLGKWLLRLADYREFDLPPGTDEFLGAAVLLVKAASSLEGTSGEYKRHAVYSQLIKQFPNANKNLLALAIEYAVYRSS